MRRLFVCSALLFVPLVTICPAVKAQCTGYSANVTYTPLSPSDAAARGQVTITNTVYGSNVSGNLSSHAITVTPGTWIGIDVTTRNAVSRSWYFIVNGGSTHYGAGSTSGFSGTQTWPNPQAWLTNSSQIGNTYQFFNTAVDANGNSTQDALKFAVVAGSSPSIIGQDGIGINGYAEITINFGGGSMLNNCQQCQGGSTQHCLQATHTPYVTLTAVNHTSGESQSILRQQAGNIATATESVSGSGSIFISLLPGDTVDGTANGEILCSMFGDLPISGNDDWGIDWELAWTKFSTIQSSCLPAGGNPPSIGCKVTWKYMCDTTSQPPDLQPTVVFAEYDTNGNPVTLETVPPFWWGWGFGIRGHVSMFTTPWIFPANVLQQYGKIDYLPLKISAGAFPSNSTIRKCTNKDLGTKPEVFPPLDQP